MAAATLALIVSGNAKKGDVIGTARIAGIMAAKRTHELIPLCHPHRPDSRSPSTSSPTTTLPGLRVTRDRQGRRPDRRRDGGADGGLGRLPDHLRHGQGGRPRHGDHRHPADREARRPLGQLEAESDEADGAAAGRRSDQRGSSAAVTPVDAEAVALGAAFGRTLADDLAAERTQPPFAASSMDGYAVRAADVAGARRRSSGWSAWPPPAPDITASSDPARRSASSPARRCRKAPTRC